MWAILLPILRNNKLSSFLSLMVIAGLVIIGAQHVRVSFLTDEVTAQKQTIADLTEANSQLKAAVDLQNTAIEAIKKDSARRIAESAKALEAAKVAVALSGSRAADIMNMKVFGSECEQARQVIANYYVGLEP